MHFVRGAWVPKPEPNRFETGELQLGDGPGRICGFERDIDIVHSCDRVHQWPVHRGWLGVDTSGTVKTPINQTEAQTVSDYMLARMKALGVF